jgi:hypothetical protein
VDGRVDEWTTVGRHRWWPLSAIGLRLQSGVSAPSPCYSALRPVRACTPGVTADVALETASRGVLVILRHDCRGRRWATVELLAREGSLESQCAEPEWYLGTLATSHLHVFVGNIAWSIPIAQQA